MLKKVTNTAKSMQSVVARSDDGTVQITFTIPFAKISKAREAAAEVLGKDTEVPGFRKGHAPLSKVLENIPENTLLEKTLSGILPELLAKAIKEHKIAAAVYPKFELLKAKEGEDWQIRGTTCELPKIDLGDYKSELSGTAKAKTIWTPGSAKDAKPDDNPKSPTREEKEQQVIKTLLDKINIKIPKILIDEEANSRLAKLLERLEKLGLSLESYLASIGKTAQTLRSEYEAQAKSAIELDLILNEVALKENITVDTKEVDAAVSAAQADPKLAKELDTPERRRFIEVILKRRKALDTLTSLV